MAAVRLREYYSARMVQITFEGRRYPVRPDENALDALVRGGASVEHSCRRGSCQVCILKCVDGEVGGEATRRLPQEAREKGYFLPCQCKPAGDLTVARPEREELFVQARVEKVMRLAPGITRIVLEPFTVLSCLAGQYINLRTPDGLVRSYSLGNIVEDDYFVEIDVKRIEGGKVSGWLCDALGAEDTVEISGPTGDCFLREVHEETPLVLIGTGTGVAPMIALAREALRKGWGGKIHLYHGVRDARTLYATEALSKLKSNHARFDFSECVSGGEGPLEPSVYRGRAVDAAFCRDSVEPHAHVYVAGHPDAVDEARARAMACGVPRRAIHSDSFEFAHTTMPRDREKIGAIEPDPELWNALEQGSGLRAILEDFYARAFQDPRLSPFFQHVTKQRAIDKQFSFTADLINGTKNYFGLGPFNAHHWMVISDDLFDHRERLFQECIERHGLEKRLMYRWLSLHERFRREIVKTRPRGLIVEGVERDLEGYDEDTLTIGSLCDGCQSEMPAGTTGRFHRRTGELFCQGCTARRVEDTPPPPVS